MKSIRAAAALLLALTLAGCATMQKPWGEGAFWGGVVGAAAAGTSLGVAANNGTLGSDIDNAKRGGAAGGGRAGGGGPGGAGRRAPCAGPPFSAPAPPPPPPRAPPPPPAPVAK